MIAAQRQGNESKKFPVIAEGKMCCILAAALLSCDMSPFVHRSRWILKGHSSLERGRLLLAARGSGRQMCSCYGIVAIFEALVVYVSSKRYN